MFFPHIKNNIKKEDQNIHNKIEIKVEDGQLLSTIKFYSKYL